MSKQPKNIAHSIHEKLLSKAKIENRPFNELLQYYAMERFLYRLSKSAHKPYFILKGALCLKTFHCSELRPTMDIDLLGKTNNDESHIVEKIKDILSVKVESDGLIFDSETIQGERIVENAYYAGIRVQFSGFLGTAKIRMQVDIGFDDIIYPAPEESEFPTVLDAPAPQLLCYSRESVIAEKFESIIKIGELNSRMKDFYDIWLLSRQFNFSGQELAHAIELTFQHRGTDITDQITAFSDSYIGQKHGQWNAFRRKIGQVTIPEKFETIVKEIDSFLRPVAQSLCRKTSVPSKWIASGVWKER